MKYKEIVTDRYKIDPDSPTGLTKLSTNKPAGLKQRLTNGGYTWIIKEWVWIDENVKKQIIWPLHHVIYELHHGIEPQRSQMINYIDGNKDNHDISNLELIPCSVLIQIEQKKRDWEAYRTLILPKRSPDFHRAPSEWETEKALKMLEDERKKREEGKSKEPGKNGRPYKWS
ncbi:hypothetical protein HZV87_004432 [Salmonella enterica]|nr:hypothetical protein [Salmonella enterica]